jgi:hypothetical protein
VYIAVTPAEDPYETEALLMLTRTGISFVTVSTAEAPWDTATYQESPAYEHVMTSIPTGLDADKLKDTVRDVPLNTAAEEDSKTAPTTFPFW